MFDTCSSLLRRIVGGCAIMALFICVGQIGAAQNILEGSEKGTEPLLRQSLLAAFESSEPLKDLPCTIAPLKPQLSLDLKFHGGYQIGLQTQELAETGDRLTILFRVAPLNQPEKRTYFSEQYYVPPVRELARGVVMIPGRFALGPGSYRIELLVHDSAEHFCSASWKVSASLSPKDDRVALALDQDAVTAIPQNVFLAEPAHKTSQAPLQIKILANFAPRTTSAAALDESDTEALVSILRNISRDPRVGTISLVAFNLYEERVVFRQDKADRIDFPALGESLKKLKPGTVDVNQLLDKRGAVNFLSGLVTDESNPSHPDALIFVGPKAFVEGSPEELKSARSLGYPVFYLNYVDNPQRTPWRDNIGKVTKLLGGREFSIAGPRDLRNAVTETLMRTFDFRTSALAGQARSTGQ